MPEFKAGKLTFGGDAKKLAFALNAVGNKDTVKPLVALIDSGKVPKENLHGLYLLLTQIGGPEELHKVLERAAAKGVSPAERDALVLAVEQTVRLRKVSRPKDLDIITSLWSEGAAAHASVRLIGLWKVEELRFALEAGATAKAATPAVRATSLESLALFGDAKAKEFIMNLCADPKPEVQRPAIIAYASLDLGGAANFAARYLEHAKPEPEVADLVAAVVGRKGGPAAFAKALKGSRFDSPDVARIALRAVRASGQPADDLAAALTAAGDLAAARKPPTPDEVKAMVADVAKADAARGELIYRRKELQCLACHAIGGAGGQVGPDMTSIGASAQPDYLVESLLIPNKAVKEGYHAMRVVTNDDRVTLGIKVREANGLLVLRTPEDKEVTIPVKDILERGEAKSIMPEGMTDTLTKQEFADLVRFLTELGKIGPYAPNKARLVRRWEVIEPSNANLNAFRRTRVSAAAEADNAFAWSPAYSLVSGDLPLASLPKFSVWANTAEQTVLRFNLDVTTAGAAKLKINSVAGLSLYVGANPVEPKAETILDLKAGVQTLTLIIDRSKRTEDVRVELDDVPNSPARVSVIGGK
jgi:putative heme-binding domain-containing protein